MIWLHRFRRVTPARTRLLKDVWRSMQPDSCAVEECPNEGNVYLWSGNDGDVYMCAKHAVDWVDR